MLSAHTERIGARTRQAARVDRHGQAQCPAEISEVRAGSSSAPPSSIARCSAVLNRARRRRGAWLGASCARREDWRKSYRGRKKLPTREEGTGKKEISPSPFEIWVAAVARCCRHTHRGSGLEQGRQQGSTRMGRLSAPQEDRAGSSSAPPSSIACCSAVLNRARTLRGAWLGASCARREGRRKSYRERKNLPTREEGTGKRERSPPPFKSA